LAFSGLLQAAYPSSHRCLLPDELICQRGVERPQRLGLGQLVVEPLLDLGREGLLLGEGVLQLCELGVGLGAPVVGVGLGGFLVRLVDLEVLLGLFELVQQVGVGVGRDLDERLLDGYVAERVGLAEGVQAGVGRRVHVGVGHHGIGGRA
jgi:hypothetical protein